MGPNNTSIIKFVRLECIKGNHNKFYEIELVSLTVSGIENAAFEVIGRYGRIGSTPKEIVKYSGNSANNALSEFSKLKQEKLIKGYDVLQSIAESIIQPPKVSPKPNWINTENTPPVKKVHREEKVEKNRWDRFDLD